MKPNLQAALLLLAAVLPAQTGEPTGALPGIDVLAQQQFAALRGKKLGLITNHTGITADGRRSIDVLHATDACELVCLFSPEHGIAGALDRSGIAHGVDEPTGLKVWSLYGDTRKPTAAMLQGLDTLVFDIQDIGCRFYTYASTMSLSLEAAAEHHLAFVVLDRPNPLGGERFEGPVLARERIDFVGCHAIPLRHGLTMGELARMIVGERGLQVDLTVVPCQGWRRADYFEQTLLRWVNPSPNMRSLTEAVLYPGIGLLEGTNLSVGRGTDTPFEVLGAPWCDGRQLAAWLLARKIPGVAFVPVEFTPAASRFQGQKCSGVQIAITDRTTFEPVRTGLFVACGLRALFPDAWQTGKLDWLLKHQAATEALLAGRQPDQLVELWRKDLDLFRMRRKPFLLYREVKVLQIGLERLLQSPPDVFLQARAVGLLCNQASVDRDFRHAADLLHGRFPGRLAALFGPQHGLWSTEQDNMIETAHATHPRLCIPVHSLYAESRQPTPAMLAGLDLLVVDLQDVGTRVYTYVWTLLLAMRACAAAGIPVLVLDRPNPIGGELVEGPLLQRAYRSFVGLCPLPMRHGLTLGELAQHLNRSEQVGCDLHVLAMHGWRRPMLWPDTGRAFVPPSPNLPRFPAALVYPGQVLLEGTNVSEGRGTTTPFEQWGAPFLDPYRLLQALPPQGITGCSLRPVWFEPTFHKFQGRTCGGLFVHPTDFASFRPYRTSLLLLRALRQLWPEQFAWRQPPYEYEAEKLPIDILTGGSEVRQWVDSQGDWQQVEALAAPPADWWEQVRPALLY